MGGSGLIVVVIVAAWALFLVPQWLHRRAEAAAGLADRIPEPVGDVDGLDDSRREPAEESANEHRARRRFGRRELRRVTGTPTRRPWVPAWVRRPRAHSDAAPPARSAAARRRRILALLATATLVTTVVTVIGTLLGLPVPGWLVAVPGGLMVGYLALLAVVHPSAQQPPARPAAAAPPVAPRERTATAVVPTGADPAAAAADAGPVSADEGEAEAGTWTPVPVPVPTYVTAPRAPRVVRTIDLSNPGSWAASRLPLTGLEVAVPSQPGDDAAEHDEVVQHRRAVGD